MNLWLLGWRPLTILFLFFLLFLSFLFSSFFFFCKDMPSTNWDVIKFGIMNGGINVIVPREYRLGYVSMKIYQLFLFPGPLLLLLQFLPLACQLMNLHLVNFVLVLIVVLWLWGYLYLSFFCPWLLLGSLQFVIMHNVQLDFFLSMLRLEERGWWFQQMRRQLKYFMFLHTNSSSFSRKLHNYLVNQGTS